MTDTTATPAEEPKPVYETIQFSRRHGKLSTMAAAIAERSGLTVEACASLLQAGWIYAEYSDPNEKRWTQRPTVAPTPLPARHNQSSCDDRCTGWQRFRSTPATHPCSCVCHRPHLSGNR